MDSLNEVVGLLLLLLMGCLLGEPLVSAGVEVVFESGEQLDDNDHEALSDAIAAFLEIPEKVVGENESQGDDNAEMPA